MENQINVGDQNTQQIEQNPTNQPSINPVSEKPKVNYWMISTILFCVLLVIGGLVYFNFGDFVKKLVVKESIFPTNTIPTIPNFTESNKQIKQVTIASIDTDWNQLRNDKYYYQINFPITPKVDENPENIRIIYEDLSARKSPFLASIDISLIGLLNEPIEQTASRIAPSELFEKTTINGNQAIKINYKNTYSDNPAISYGAILVRNSQNLNILIRIDTNVDNKYKELLEKSIQTFQFIDQNNLRNPDKLLLSGKVFLLSGNCMPGSGGGCNKKPISTTVLIYPLKNQNNSFTGEKNPPITTKVKSDKNGDYKVSLPPGTYSVYVDDNGRETCSGGDGNANMCGITLYESNKEVNPIISHAVF